MNDKPTSPRTRNVTMTDVAKLAGVSQTTVSFVINNIDAGLPERTKQKVLTAIKELNYSPNEAARRLASKASRAIGLAIYDISYAANYTQAGAVVIESVYRAAEARQQRLHIYTTHERQEDGADVGTYFAVPVRASQIDGIIVWDAYVDEARIISAFREGLPMVTLDRRCDDVPAVVPDYDSGFRKIAELILERGYGSICLATRKKALFRDRRARGAFMAAAMELGIPVGAITTLEVDIEKELDPAEMGGVVDRLLAREPRPRVIVCAYDAIALAMMAALRQRGIGVPDEIAVTGCAGIPVSGDPAYQLTTLDIRYDLMGQHSVDMVLRMFRGDSLAGTVVMIQPDLIVRSSA